MIVRGRRLRTWAFRVVSALAVAAMATSIQPASGTPFGVDPGGPGYLPDSQDHWFCFDGSSPTGTEANRFYSGMEYLDSSTLMYDVASSYCGSATDVIFRYQSPLAEAPGARGYAPCRVRTGYANLFCEQGDVIVDVPQIWLDAGGWSGDPNTFELNIHKTVRHEIGHTAGLGHSSGVHALESGHVPYNWGYLAYLAHDICHINTLYGGSAC
mgnify:CR=1 FL=1